MISFTQNYAPNNELCVQTMRAEGVTTTFELEPLGIVYCWVPGVSCNFDLVSNSVSKVDIIGNLICAKTGFGIRFCNEGNEPYPTDCNGISSVISPLRFSYYKVNIYVNNDFSTFFYYDNRDCSFPMNNCSSHNCYGNDITIRYDVENNEIYYKKTIERDPSLDGFKILLRGESLNWWEVQECTNYCVDGIDPRSFPVLDSPERSEYGNPILSWQPPLNWSPIFYEVERAINSESFSVIRTLNPTELTFTDYQITWGGNNLDMLVQYRVKAIFDNAELPYDFSNTQKIETEQKIQKQNIITLNSNEENGFFIQNSPNPFNPQTTISYLLTEKSNVTLKVYNVLGKEVSQLLFNTEQEVGIHSVNFDATNFQSGIYFYHLSTENGNRKFVQTKKMILQK
jgi:hypothetical protein